MTIAFSLFYHCLEQCIAHSRCPVNIYWMNEPISCFCLQKRSTECCIVCAYAQSCTWWEICSRIPPAVEIYEPINQCLNKATPTSHCSGVISAHFLLRSQTQRFLPAFLVPHPPALKPPSYLWFLLPLDMCYLTSSLNFTVSEGKGKAISLRPI